MAETEEPVGSRARLAVFNASTGMESHVCARGTLPRTRDISHLHKRALHFPPSLRRGIGKFFRGRFRYAARNWSEFIIVKSSRVLSKVSLTIQPAEFKMPAEEEPELSYPDIT